jgi:hypothetical protein
MEGTVMQCEECLRLHAELQKAQGEIEALKKALWAECKGEACSPEECYGGYRQCSGCEKRAKAVLGDFVERQYPKKEEPKMGSAMEKAWKDLQVDLYITHISGWPLREPIHLKPGDRLQHNGVEILGPETILAIGSDTKMILNDTSCAPKRKCSRCGGDHRPELSCQERTRS